MKRRKKRESEQKRQKRVNAFIMAVDEIKKHATIRACRLKHAFPKKRKK